MTRCAILIPLLLMPLVLPAEDARPLSLDERQAAADAADRAARVADQQAFLAQVEPVLLQADSVELLSLDPAEQGEDETALAGWRELGRTKLGADDAKAVAAALRKSVEANAGFAMMCFEARHAIVARRGESRLELLVCFECCQAKGTLDRNPLRACVDPVGEAVFDRVLKAANVPLAEKHR